MTRHPPPRPIAEKEPAKGAGLGKVQPPWVRGHPMTYKERLCSRPCQRPQVSRARPWVDRRGRASRCLGAGGR